MQSMCVGYGNILQRERELKHSKIEEYRAIPIQWMEHKRVKMRKEVIMAVLAFKFNVPLFQVSDDCATVAKILSLVYSLEI